MITTRSRVLLLVVAAAALVWLVAEYDGPAQYEHCVIGQWGYRTCR